jgi:hypothetical protein
VELLKPMRNVSPFRTIIASLVISAPLGAQQLTIPGADAATSSTTGTVTATEAAFRVRLAGIRATAAESYTSERSSDDSSARAVMTMARQWVARLRGSAIRGIQRDPYGVLLVVARHDSLAHREIATRLATPGITVNDKAYTYLSAVNAFAINGVPERLPFAETYAAALDSLGSSAAVWQFAAHRTLQSVYYTLGRSGDVIRHGLRAVAVVNDIAFADRGMTTYSPNAAAFYGELIDALSGQPDAREKIAAVNATLVAGTIPSSALIMLDSGFVRRGKWYAESVHGMIQAGGRIGTRGEDIEGNYWVNLPRKGTWGAATASIPVSNGKITILEVGSFNCPGCITSLAGLQRLQRRYPGIQTVFATWALGYWGNRLVDGHEEAAHLAEQFMGRNMIVDVPISIWIAKKTMTEDDGMLPENAGPNLVHYPMAGKPNFYIFDSTGRIRLVHLSGLERDTEARFARTIEFLLKETQQ